MAESTRRVTAVVLAYGVQPLLVPVVDAVLASEGVGVDVILVDNGGEAHVVEELRTRPRLSVVTPGRNLGFAAGCNLGAREARGEVLAFVNGDAVIRADALAKLVAALAPDVGMATASVRLHDQPDIINSAGNPVHFLGLSWAGGMGRPATEYAETRNVTAASGATAVIERDLFLSVGGFCEDLFTYVEDTDLSLRLWSRGHGVVFVPDAVVLHDYAFSRNPGKFYLLERNRLFVVLTLFPARLLALVLPVLIGLELAVLALGLRQGWGLEKVRGWWWLLRHPGLVRRRRREEAAARVLPDREFAALLTSTFDPGVAGFALPGLAQVVLDRYWSVVRRAL